MIAVDNTDRWGLFRAIFEKGVDARLDDDGFFYFQSVRQGEPIKWTPPSGIEIFKENIHGLRPLLFAYYQGPHGIQEILLSPTASSPYGLYHNVENALLPLLGEKRLSVEHFHDLIYVFGEAIYHCSKLAYEYCNIARRFSQAQVRYNGEETGESFAVIRNCNALYEFDALVTAISRCYSMIRIVLWGIYCKGYGTRPGCFEKFLRKSEHYLPAELYTRLDASWNSWGKKANDYRDFVQHYYTLTITGWPLPKTKHLGGGLWCVSIVLPDNPEDKSRKTLRFEKDVDALTYGWELVGHMEIVFLEIARSKACT